MAGMKLYVCYGTFRPDRHPCGSAYEALAAAGHEPEIENAWLLRDRPALQWADNLR
jgi:hypothetical protein